MKAEIITYETKNMSNSKRSIISKRIFGFTDQTKKSTYIYKRKGILKSLPHVIITKKTFVIKAKNAKKIKKTIKKLGANVKSWKIEISEKKLRKTYG